MGWLREGIPDAIPREVRNYFHEHSWKGFSPVFQILSIIDATDKSIRRGQAVLITVAIMYSLDFSKSDRGGNRPAGEIRLHGA